MPKRKPDSANRSLFIRTFLGENKRAKYKDVVAAWKAKGGVEPISNSLFYQVKGSKRKGKGRAKATEQAIDSATESYQSIEQRLDQLVAQAEHLRDSRLASALRVARRCASAKLV